MNGLIQGVKVRTSISLVTHTVDINTFPSYLELRLCKAGGSTRDRLTLVPSMGQAPKTLDRLHFS